MLGKPNSLRARVAAAGVEAPPRPLSDPPPVEDAPTAPLPPTAAPRKRSLWSRRPKWLRWRPGLRRLHGWLALLTGVILLIVVLSGTILLYQPEIDKVLHPGLYKSTESDDPVSPAEALHNVRDELPHFNDAATVVLNRGSYEIYSADYMRQAHVDPGTGEVTGVSSHDTGFFGFLANLHTCGLTCKDYPGYAPWLKNPKFEILDNKFSVGTAILAGSAIVLIILSLTGLVLWWPGIKRMARGLTIRRGKSRYATNYDLHKVFGFVALPFLLMWAITGASFEIKQVEEAWYAVLPGNEPPKKFPTFESDPKSGDGIGPEEAAAIAVARVPDSEMTSITMPAPSDKKGYYDIWVTDGWDSYRGGEWPGDAEVAVDRWGGETKVLYAGPDTNRSVAWQLWEDWSYPLHAGVAVPWIPRIVWLGFGLVPLLLAITGTTVWWIRRRKRRAKRKRKPPAVTATA